MLDSVWQYFTFVAGSIGPRRQVEIVRVPLLTQPSIYHDPSKLAQSVLADNSMLARLTPPSSASNVPIMQTTVSSNVIVVVFKVETQVTIGPFPLHARITAENRYGILARLIRSVYYQRLFYKKGTLSGECAFGTNAPRRRNRCRVRSHTVYMQKWLRLWRDHIG